MICKDCGKEHKEPPDVSMIANETIMKVVMKIAQVLDDNQIEPLVALAAMEVLKSDIVERTGLHIASMELRNMEVH